MSERKEYYLDFYCPSCGRKHENVRHERRSEDESHVWRYGINCPCGMELKTFASLNWAYVDIVAMDIDGETTVREEVDNEP